MLYNRQSIAGHRKAQARQVIANLPDLPVVPAAAMPIKRNSRPVVAKTFASGYGCIAFAHFAQLAQFNAEIRRTGDIIGRAWSVKKPY
jgi:hypothetical protein